MKPVIKPFAPPIFIPRNRENRISLASEEIRKFVTSLSELVYCTCQVSISVITETGGVYQ